MTAAVVIKLTCSTWLVQFSLSRTLHMTQN